MKIRCHGARGSIPVSGPQYDVYGGDTTCLEIRTGNDHVILVDAGTGIRTAGNRLIAEGRFEYTLLFTHAHWDHILGFPFFKPVFHPNAVIDLYGCPTSQGNMMRLLARTMTPPYFPVPFDKRLAAINYHATCDEPIQIDDVTVTSIVLSHPNMGLGFKFVQGERSFVFLTDNEFAHPHRGGKSMADYAAFAAGADLLVHDAEYDENDYARTKGWGHSLYSDAATLAAEAGVTRYGLFHHNQDRDDAGVDALVEASRKILGKKGANTHCFAMAAGQELEL